MDPAATVDEFIAPVAGVLEVGPDGRIVLWRDYFDLQSFTDQMAALSPPA